MRHTIPGKHGNLVQKHCKSSYAQYFHSGKYKDAYFNQFFNAALISPILFAHLNQLHLPGGNRTNDDQPLMFSSNMQDIIRLAEKERRKTDLLGGICPIGESRILLNDGTQSVDLMHGDLASILGLHDAKLHTENLGYEPSIGKVIEFFRYFSIAATTGLPLRFLIASEEYLLTMRETLGIIGIDPSGLEAAVKSFEERIKGVIHNLHDKYFKGTDFSISFSTDPEVDANLARLANSEDLERIMGILNESGLSFSKISGRTSQSEILAEKRYTAEWLSKDGEWLTERSSPSRIILIAEGDIYSYLPQSIWAYNGLAQDVKARDRIAFIRVSSAPQIRQGTEEYELHDYHGKPENVLFLGEDKESIASKIISGKPFKGASQRSTNCVVYFLLEELNKYMGGNPKTEELLSNCAGPIPRYQHQSCKLELVSRVLELKENIGL